MLWLFGAGVFFPALLTICIIAALEASSLERRYDRRWGRLLGWLLIVGFALMGTGSIMMMQELSNSVPCAVEQSALAGVCVPVTEAG
jgi:quinol-cytochrome oxidoreductase complex cytochrome b subunit